MLFLHSQYKFFIIINNVLHCCKNLQSQVLNSPPLLVSAVICFNTTYNRKHNTIQKAFQVSILESLANAKISARQPWYIGHNSLHHSQQRNNQQYQHNLYIAEKHFQCATNPLLTMRVYLHLFSHCCLPKMRSSAKF